MAGFYALYELSCTDVRQVPKPNALPMTAQMSTGPDGADNYEFGGYDFDLSAYFAGENPTSPPDVNPQAVADPGAPPTDPSLWSAWLSNEELFIQYGAAKDLYDQYQGQLDTNNDGTIDVTVTLPENFDPSMVPSAPTPPGPPPAPGVDDYDNKYKAWKATFDAWETSYRDYSVKKSWHDLYVKEAYENASGKCIQANLSIMLFNRLFFRKQKNLKREYADCISAVMENAAREDKEVSKRESSLKSEIKKFERMSMQRSEQNKKAMDQRIIKGIAKSFKSASKQPTKK